MTILNGAGAPNADDGADGDFWINITAWSIFGPKTAGAWPTGVSLIGPGVAAQVAYDDTVTGLGVDNVQDALDAIWTQSLGPQDDFSNPFNSGLGLIIGAI
ncbi:hypothetical protein [Caulobacter soli]|uniref:hypothetical protein n=1 Tax=Caulobacter soli TaxID=2708539 RepID=UPI0013EE0965|nr:hypothetical protein [Caulobacter soli]